MKLLLIVGFLTHFNCMFGQKLTRELEFARDFLDDMRNGEDVRNYLSSNYIKENQLENTDWQADYFLIKHFTITEIDKMIIHIEIDHGSGEFCTSFQLTLLEEEGVLKILPDNFFYVKKIKRYIVTPWKERKKLC